MGIEQTEEASNLWFAFRMGRMGRMNELKNRGVKDMLLVSVDGLTGFPEAIAYSSRRNSICVWST
ncbi:hypothetical protein Holit_00190 [Hollandina sp. SP2]